MRLMTAQTKKKNRTKSRNKCYSIFLAILFLGSCLVASRLDSNEVVVLDLLFRDFLWLFLWWKNLSWLENKTFLYFHLLMEREDSAKPLPWIHNWNMFLMLHSSIGLKAQTFWRPFPDVSIGTCMDTSMQEEVLMYNGIVSAHSSQIQNILCPGLSFTVAYWPQINKVAVTGRTLVSMDSFLS